MLNIIQNRKIFFGLSVVFTSISLLSLVIFGLKLGIDFTGGSLLEIEFSQQRPSAIVLTSKLEPLGLGKIDVQPSSEKGYILRMKPLAEQDHQKIISTLKNEFASEPNNIEMGNEQELSIPGSKEETISSSESKENNVQDNELKEQDSDSKASLAVSYKGNELSELRFDSIGPVIGSELKKRALSSLLLVLIAIVIYIAWAFRKVSWPVQSWKYGLVAIVALFHDVLIVTGIFVLLGHFIGVEINTPFVAALLTILGYSVNDTIVVFDRIRENIGKMKGDFEGLVNNSVNETIVRSVNTSVTTLLVLLSIYFFGGASIQEFVLALIFGVVLGTYSSIFLASPLLVVWHYFKK